MAPFHLTAPSAALKSESEEKSERADDGRLCHRRAARDHLQRTVYTMRLICQRVRRPRHLHLRLYGRSADGSRSSWRRTCLSIALILDVNFPDARRAAGT